MSWRAMPNVFWGAAIGLYFREIKQFVTKKPWVGVVVGLMGGCCVLSVGVFGRNRLLEVLSGALLFGFAALPWNGKIATALGNLGRYSYGVYLTHVAFVLGLDLLLVKDRNQMGFFLAFFIWATSVALSLGASMAIKKFKFLRWLLP
jgi:peptidoglycan/LPS O-acetylase OafA/YrhL